MIDNFRNVRAASVLALVVSSAVSVRVLSAQAARLDVSPPSVSLDVGEREDVIAMAESREGDIVDVTFVWEVQDPTIARVEEDASFPGLVSIVALSAGSTSVTVRAGDLSQPIPVEVKGFGPCFEGGVVPSGPPAVVQIDPPTIYLMPAEDMLICPRFLASDGSPATPVSFTWLSLRPDVATIDASGMMVAITEGPGLIQLSVEGLGDARATVQVAQVPWAFSREAVSLAPGEDDSVAVVVPQQENRGVEPRYFSWQTTDRNVAIISPLGVVTAIAAGQAEIVASAFGQQSRLPVVVHKAVDQWGVRPTGDTVSLPIGGSLTFVATAYAADQTPVVEAPQFWSVGDTSIAEYTDTLATGKSIGVTTLTFSDGEGPLRTWVLNIVAAGLVLDRDRMTLSIGGSVALSASFADSTGTPVGPASQVSWTSSAPQIAQVDDGGNVVAIGYGSAQIIGATPWNNADTATVFVQGMVLFTSTRARYAVLYGMDPADTASIHHVVNDPGQSWHAAYSPDGTRIAFTSDRDGQREIYIVDADGQNPTRLTQTTTSEGAPTWTPDGQSIVYESDASGEMQIWIMSAEGTNHRPLTQGERYNGNPRVSPDGETIAFVSSRDGNGEIYLMNIDGSGQRNFTSTPDLSEDQPHWSGNDAIVFRRGPRRGDDQNRSILRMSFERATDVLQAGRPITSFAINPSGDLLAMVEVAPGPAGDVYRMFLVPLNGGNPTSITGQGTVDQITAPNIRPHN